MRLYVLPVLMLLILLSGCNKKSYFKNEGFVFGTTYHIVYENNQDVHELIRTRFKEYDGSMSTYNKSSLISRVNRNETDQADSLLTNVITKAFELNRLSDGGFDITIAPLANAWGFGFSKADSVTQTLIDSLLIFTGMDKIRLDGNRVVKNDSRIMLETSALAEGYGVDVIGVLLEGMGITNYMVEVGGEVRLRGKNPKGAKWSIGIDKPIDDSDAESRELQEILLLTDRAVSTSGSYRKFFMKEGKRYSHTINPKTGYPVFHNLLSTTVVAHDCISTDGLATCFMVLGLDKALPLAESLPDVEAYFIYADSLGNLQTAMTSGFDKLIKK